MLCPTFAKAPPPLKPLTIWPRPWILAGAMVQLDTFHPQRTGPRRGERLGARSLVLLREAVAGKTERGAP